MNLSKQAFLDGYLSKFASDEEGGAINGIIGTGAHAGSWALNKGILAAALAPALGGISAGALASKFTSPSTEKDVVQKSLIAAELEEAVAELKRKRAVDLRHKEMENGGTERSLHI
jgi:hypothetical protein